MDQSFDFDVFLSYSTADNELVRALACRLKEVGLRVWFDEWEIRPGDSIYLKIEKGLERSGTLILCMSRHAFSSDWATFERSVVLFVDPNNNRRRLIPLLLSDCVIPPALRRLRYIDARRPVNIFLPELLNALRNDVVVASASKPFWVDAVEDVLRGVEVVKRSIIRRENVIDEYTPAVELIMEICGGEGQPLSIAYFDVDGFTGINRAHGETAGDAVLDIIGEILQKSRPCLYAIRWLGDGFVCLMPGANVDEAMKAGEMVLREVSSYEWERVSPGLYVLGSMGVAEAALRELASESIERAYHGAKNAKKAGGNKVVQGPLTLPNHLKRQLLSALDS